MSKPAAAAASSAHKRKRADGASSAAPAVAADAAASAPDLAQWMRDVIAAPVAPEDRPDPAEERALPADAIVDEESSDDEDAVAVGAAAVGSSSALSALSAAAGAGASRPAAYTSSIPRAHFGSVRDLFTCLTSSKGDTVFSGLVRFHRQMKDETTFGPSSAAASASAGGASGGSLLAQYWSLSPDAKELFSLLDSIKSFDSKKQNQILGKIFEVFARMILPSSAGFDYERANALIRRVVRSKHFGGGLARITKMQDQRLVHAGLTFMLHTVICCGSNVTHLAGVGSSAAGAAKSAVAIVEPTGPKAPSRGSNALLREFVMKFEWSAKWFLEIPTKPFAAQGAGAAAAGKKSEKTSSAAAVAHTEQQQTMLIQLSKSRLLYIHILIELLAKRDLAITSYLLGIKGYVTSVLKNLKNDPTTAQHLDALLHGFVHHILYLPGLAAQAKFGFFNSYVLEHLMELFRPRTNLILLSNPAVSAAGAGGKKKGGGSGGLKAVSSKEALELIERTLREFIAYLSKHQVSAAAAVNLRQNRVALADNASQATSLKQHGPLLLRILHSLHANESAAEQRLLLDILSSFPVGLLAEFLAHFSYTFDPRPSFRWVNHVALICKIWEMRWEQKLAALAQAHSAHTHAPAFIGGGASKAAQVEDEFVMLHPLQPLGVKSSSSSSSASASSSAAAVPTLFAFLLPSTLSQRIILSQCIQHSSSLVKYTTLNMLRSLLLRFEQLAAEYEREWRRAQGLSSQAPRPAMLQASLASCRAHLAKILPDVQVLFGLRTKLLPAQSLTIEEMQAELEGPEDSASGSAAAEAPAKKARVASDSKQQLAKAADDSATADQSVESTADLALKSRHVVYSRFLAVLASYARALPEALLEGRIDVFKLLPASLSGVAGSAQPSLSWWALNELMDVLAHASAWKHTRLFGLTQQTKSGSNQPADPAAVALVPLSYFGQMLRLYHALCEPASEASTLLMVNGHESVLSTGGDRPSQASPARVTERVKEFLTQVLLHTGLFSSASAAASGSSAYNRSAFEEIHLWLSSLRSAADLRFFEHLVAHLVNTNSVAGAWGSSNNGKEESSASKASSEVKLSILLSTACSASFQAYFISATPYAEVDQLASSLSGMISRFIGRAVASPTMGGLIHEQISAALEARTLAAVSAAASSVAAPKKVGSNALFASLPSSLPALLKHVQSSKVVGSAASSATPGSLEAFQSALTNLRAKPSSKSGAELVVRLASEHFAVPHRAESTKGVLLAYAREALLGLLGSGSSSGAEAGAVWRAVASVIRSAEFEAPIPEAAPLSAEHCECTPTVAAARLAVVLAPSVSGAAGAMLLKDHFSPAAEDALTKQVASFLLSLPLATEPALHELAAPMLNAVVQACLELGKTAAPELHELPFTLHLLQQCLPLLSREQLSSVSHALCDPATAWVLRIASLPASASSAYAAKLGEQLLQHGGANSIQMLAGMLMASAKGVAPAAEKKKSSKKAAAASSASAASPLVLERLLLKLLSSSNVDASLWLSQLQPAFFAFCLESITAPAAASASSSNAESDVAAGSELFAQLAALFLSSEVSSLYVALFVQHVSQRFGSESGGAAEFDEAAQAELVQLLPLLVRAASSSHLALVGAEQAAWFVSFVLRALSQALLPYFLAHHAAASKASAAPAAVARMEAITELVRVVCLSGSFAAQFSLEKRQQLLQFVLTGSKPELIGSDSAAAAAAASSSKKSAPAKKQSKKKQSSKMTDSDSSSSSDSDSDDDDADVAMSAAVPAADSKYEVFDSLRFSLAHTLLTAVPTSTPAEVALAVAEGIGAAPASAAVRASLAQSYSHLLSQAFSTLSKGLKAAAKTKEAHAAVVAAASAAMLGGDFDMTAASTASKPAKGLLSPEFERRLLAALNELLSTGMDSTFLAHSASPAAKAANWVAMLPLSSLLRESPNASLSAQLLGAYSKLFPSLLRFAYTSLAHQTLLRNALLLQLSGSFSRGVFLSRIVSLRSNMHFTTVIEGGEEEEGEAQEEPEVPSLLSICALASSPDAENFQPLAAIGGSKGQDALREAASQVPTAQALFEMMVGHSKFVSVIAPGAVAHDEADGDAEEEEARAGAAQALQLEFLRILLLLFSFPDSSPPADFSLQSNLWLLLLSQFHASISASDSYIKLLLDLFEEIALGAAARKRHKKMEFELIVSQRKWGDAGLAALTSRMSDGDAAAEAVTLTNQDPALWLYTNFNAAMLYKGPVVSRIPQSRIQSHVAAASAGVAEQAIIQEQTAVASEDAAAASSAAGMVDDTSSSSDLRYDPSFLLPFLHHFLVHHSADLRKLIELNLLGYVIQCMSHQSLAIRRMAYATMGKFQSALESANEKLNAEKAAEKKAAEEAAVAATAATKKDEDASDSDDEIGGSRSKRGLPPLAPVAAPAKADKLDKNAKGSKTWEAKKALYHDAHRSRSTHGLQALGADGQPLLYSFKEYPQIALLLTSLKNGITQKFQRLPHIVSTFLARILPILLRPDHALYKIVNRFLLARPLLDLSDIPLFYNLFQSSAPGDAFRFQRNFILKVLRDGFSTAQDYPLVHRRHVATILMAYVSNRALSDKYTRGHSLQMMEGGLSASPNFLAEILRVHALLPWIHAQLLATTQANQWAPGIVPILRVLDRACQELRGKIPAQPEEDIAVDVDAAGEAELVEEEDAVARATGKEAEDEDDSSSSSSEDDDDEEEKKAEKKSKKASAAADDDADMKDADSAAAAPSTKVAKKRAAAAPKSRAAKAPLSPQAEALKALRKRQRQRAQVSRELNLLLEALATKFHEFCWSERIVSVVAPSAAAFAGAHAPASAAGSAAAAPALQPLSTQLSVVEFVLSLMVSMLQTSAKAHVASKRLTNRAQMLTEGRVGGGVQASGKGPMDQYAPFAFRPAFLEALSTLPTASATLGSKLSATALDHLSQLLLLSSPTPVIPSGLSGMVSSVVADSPKDVKHLFHAISFHARAVLSGHAASTSSSSHVHALIEWLSLLLESHPRLASRSTAKLNAIFVRILGIGADATIVDKALSVAPLSPAQRQAYSSAVAALSTHAVPLFTASPSGTDSSASSVAQWTMAQPTAVSAAQWTNAFASLLLQELCAMQMDHAMNAARVAAPAGPSRQSAAFAMLAATRSSVDKAAEDGWSEAQRSIIKALKSTAASFA